MKDEVAAPRSKVGRPSLGPVGNIQPTLMWLNKDLVRLLNLEVGNYYEILVLEDNPEHPMTYILAPSDAIDGAQLKGNDVQGYRLSNCYRAMQHIRKSIAELTPGDQPLKLRVRPSDYKPQRGVAVRVVSELREK